jgi:hypothetical protein
VAKTASTNRYRRQMPTKTSAGTSMSQKRTEAF